MSWGAQLRKWWRSPSAVRAHYLSGGRSVLDLHHGCGDQSTTGFTLEIVEAWFTGE